MVNILSKIEHMLVERNWSERELSIRADIPQSTINTWYRKHQIPTLYSLDKISKAFGITLSQLLAEEGDPVELTEQDKEFLDIYNAADPEQKEILLTFLESIVKKNSLY